jgi:hypothetical protein
VKGTTKPRKIYIKMDFIMSKTKPTSEEYEKWLKDEQGIAINNIIRNNYESVTMKIRDQFERSKFWVDLTRDLKRLDQKYYSQNKDYYLFMSTTSPVILIKSFDPFLLKTYRKNILYNKNWPNEPNDGWILPSNWYSRINDIVRTLFVVKYIDGVEFMINELGAYCVQCSILPETHFEAREEGYYAAHLYIRQKFEVPNVEWDTEIIDVSIEIQVTTQLQDVIRRLLHKYYEDHRKNFNRDENWQWNYKSEEFAANYLGHILHYVEGMIVEIRDREKSVK